MRRRQDGKIVLIDFGAVKEIGVFTVNSKGLSQLSTGNFPCPLLPVLFFCKYRRSSQSNHSEWTRFCINIIIFIP